LFPIRGAEVGRASVPPGGNVMKVRRRQFLQFAGAIAAAFSLPQRASALDYPVKPVRIVVGFPPGGVTDMYARLMGQVLSEWLGRSFIVENRPGAGGTIATESVVRATPDGYTLLLANASDSWNATLYDNLRYKFIDDIAPVASITRGMGVLVVNPSFPAKTVPEFIAYAKANPGKIAVASSGVGSSPHVYWELFKSMTGVDGLHVPYRGDAPALTDLLGGQVQVYFSNMPPVIEHIKAGRLRALAVTTATRVEMLPDIPALPEFVPGFEGTGWIGIGAPKNTPAEIIDKLNREINAGLADPKIKARITELGGVPTPMTPTDFGRFIVEYTGKWAKVIRAANIRAE
jgi:tripartite-type tricarboxylate transporter receptor subunit TctC